MGYRISRRCLQGAGMALLASAAFGRHPLAQDGPRKQLRFMWWGGQDRLRRTMAAFAAFEQRYPGVRATGEASANGGPFWAKLATQVAGGNAPDVYQMDYRVEAEYGIRGAALPLDPFMPDLLDMRDFPAYARDAGKVDGKTYAVSLGTNSTAIFYDRDIVAAAGIVMPDHNWTWEDFARIAVEIAQASKGKLVGTTDFAYNEYAYQTWIRQRGKELYTAEGRLGYAAEDMAEWLDFWTRLRLAGGTLAPAIQALDKDSIDSNGMITGKTAMTFAYSNQFVAFQRLKKGRLAITTDPQGGAGAPPGRYLKAALLACVYAKSKYPEDAVRLIDFMIRDPEAVKILGVDRGVPNSAAALAIVLPTLGEADRMAVDYVRLVAETTSSPVPPPPPKGASEIWLIRRGAVEAVAFGMESIGEASRAYVREATRILDEARAG
jgi:multiple sugar transport system substrate-binding protein